MKIWLIKKSVPKEKILIKDKEDFTVIKYIVFMYRNI
jgi:hypothetical protein